MKLVIIIIVFLTRSGGRGALEIVLLDSLQPYSFQFSTKTYYFVVVIEIRKEHCPTSS